MPIIEPDLSQIQSNVIDPGSYPAKITSAEPGISSSNNPKVVVKFDVDVGGKTYHRQSHIVTSGAGAFNFESLLRAVHMGDIADRLRAGEKVPFDTDSLIGQQLIVVVEASIYNNMPSDQIKSYLPM